uniref:Sterol carrier protein-2 HAD-2SCP-2 n=1 Tax=Toxoplasma gondii COUG TaxID=1074873 RepID=A0A2G8Y8S7_TOXGO|nr:sterol carrier protein-2 HAD-2SCP-2 [Toxoplasma gondii COUG]
MPVRFDGQVAIVTGAGGGLGREYALLLAARGAKVLVNDVGVALSGAASESAKTDQVVADIRARGGEAAADYNSVLNGQKIIDHALSLFGRVDILINNAGVLRDASFMKMTHQDWNLVLDVHVRGAYACTKAAWPVMQKQNYGRIIMTASAAGLYGNFGQANYSTAKSALVGFAKTLAFEGAKKNILVNCIAPLAGTRMTATVLPPDLVEAMKPEFVAPLVAFLCSKDCRDSGQVLEVGAGWVASVRWQRNIGHSFATPLSPDDIAREWRHIRDFSGEVAYPASLQDSMLMVMQQLQQGTKPTDKRAEQRGASDAKEEKKSGASAQEGSAAIGKAEVIFKLMDAYIRNAPDARQKLQEKVDSVFGFNVTDGKTTKSWSINLKKGNAGGGVEDGLHSSPDVLFTMAAENFVSVCLGTLNPQMAFVQGKMKIKGSMQKATKFTPSLFPPIPREVVDMTPDLAVETYLKANNFSSVPARASANEPPKKEEKDAKHGSGKAQVPSPRAKQLKSMTLYEVMKRHLATPEGEKLVKKIKSVYRLNILPRKGADPVKVILDLKNMPPSIREEAEQEHAACDCTITLLDEDFVKLALGKMNPQLAFVQGKIKLKGSMQAALKFTPDIFPKTSRL